MAKVTVTAAALLAAAIGMLASTAQATTVQTLSGSSSLGHAVSLRAELNIAGDTLTVTLSNVSGAASLAPADVLSSYYFDIVKDGNIRPTLNYVSASGDVWLTSKNLPDTLQTAGADLKAVNAGDYTWQFKALDPALQPALGFGVGTVGNSRLANSFNGNIVDGLDYSIYAGDVTTQNLNGKLLVKGSIVFTFTGVMGFTEADIADAFVFGLGTAPDSLIEHGGNEPPVPEPVTMMGMCMGLAGLAGYIRRRRLS